MPYPRQSTVMNNTLWEHMAKAAVADTPCFPQEIMLTTTYNCNYRCRMCFQDHYDRREMPWSMAEKLSDALHYADTLQIIGGEPMIYSHFKDLVALAHRTETKVRITSNGSLMDDSMRRFLMDNRIFNIKLSADAGTPKTYSLIRGGNFLKFLNNVLELSKLKAQTGSQWPILEFNFVAQRSNVAELPRLVALADSLGVFQVNVYYMNCTREDWMHESLYFHQEYSDECMARAAQAAQAVGLPINLPVPFKAPAAGESRVFSECHEPWRLLMADMDGQVTVCCGGAPVMGNLGSQEFMDIWHSPALTDLRRRVNSDDKPECCRKCFGKLQQADSIYTHFSRPIADKLLADGREAFSLAV